MKKQRFELYFVLPGGDIDALIERLAVKCGDALVGSGVPGKIALDFTREAADMYTAIETAIDGVHEAIPEAVLIETRPAAA